MQFFDYDDKKLRKDCLVKTIMAIHKVCMNPLPSAKSGNKRPYPQCQMLMFSDVAFDLIRKSELLAVDNVA